MYITQIVIQLKRKKVIVGALLLWCNFPYTIVVDVNNNAINYQSKQEDVDVNEDVDLTY